MRLDNYLLRIFKDVPKSRVYRSIRGGEVRVNKARAAAATRLAAADELRLPPMRQRRRNARQRPPDALIQRVEDALLGASADYLVFAKPAGLAVHAGSGLRFGLIEALRASRPDEYLQLVHRLDRDTSGLLLVARSRGALDALAAALNADSACKRYLALVEGRWSAGAIEIDAPLARDVQRSGERMVVVDRVRGRAARSTFIPRAYYRDATLMEISLHTGRTHQIRAHAAHSGHPVVADAKYGPNARAAHWHRRGLKRMFLHAERLSLEWSAGRETFTAPLPVELATVLEKLVQ
jgi:23S rRNA pseudouridine955/2504/2580 synthase